MRHSQSIPWDELASGYYQNLSSTHGRPAKDARHVIGAVIIKHKLYLSDERPFSRAERTAICNTLNVFGCGQAKAAIFARIFEETRFTLFGFANWVLARRWLCIADSRVAS